jgi:outer membrane protein assembly factor BamE (lipoprotein component of BamABCDE complex)
MTRWVGVRVAQVVLAGAMVVSLGGCLIGGSSKETRSGNFVAEDTFTQIEPGKTTAAWLKSTLGEPSEKTTADEAEVWKWKYTEAKTSSGYVFLLFGAKNEKETQHTVYVELKDGVVTRKWRG